MLEIVLIYVACFVKQEVSTSMFSTQVRYTKLYKTRKLCNCLVKKDVCYLRH